MDIFIKELLVNKVLQGLVIACILYAPALWALGLWHSRKLVHMRRVYLKPDLDLILPRRHSVRALYFQPGVSFYLQKSNNEPPPPTREFKVIRSIYDLPSSSIGRDYVDHYVMAYDDIRRAHDGSQLRCVFDRNLRAWRTYQPVLEKFL